MNVATLVSARNAARDAAAAHPHQAKVEAITAQIIDLQRTLKRADRTPAQKDAAAAALPKLKAEREALQAEQHAGVAKAQAALTAGRRGARAAAEETAAVKFRDPAAFSTEALELRRAELAEQRRALKLEQRAVVAALSERQAEARVATLASQLSSADKRALLQQLQAEGVESAEAVGTPGSN